MSNSSLLARESAVIPLVAAADQTDKEGYFVEIASNTTASICNSATDAPFGVILDGAAAAKTSSIGVLGGLAGTVRVKLGANITNLATMLQLRADGTAGPDAGTGARVLVGRPCELGSTDEKIEAVVFNPVVFTS
jgi:hypothetical protein